MPAMLAMRDIRKRFAGVAANDGADFDLEQGEIHALLGENGAGKSTLMRILAGCVKPDAGSIFLRGREVRINTPRDADRLGIGLVHQHFLLAPALTVAENVVLGVEPRRAWFFLDRTAAARRVAALAEEHGLPLDPGARVADLSVEGRRRTEIVKALYRDPSVLILDEPTSELGPNEAERLLALARGLAARGRCVVLIAHKLREALSVADRITVLRAGRAVATLRPAETSEAALAGLMVGATEQDAHVGPARRGAGRVWPCREISAKPEPVFVARGLTILDEQGAVAVNALDLDVFAGETHGLAGVQGSGMRVLVEALTGLRPWREGEARLRGQRLPSAAPDRFLALGGAHIPEDRQAHGMINTFTVAENLILTRFREPRFSRRGLLNAAAIQANALAGMAEYDIRGQGPRAKAGSLSGGNRQKMVLARELGRPACFLVAAQPTRGLDVRARAATHRRISAARDNGAAVLLASRDPDELLALCDRVSVLFAGRIAATLAVSDADHETLAMLMAGGHRPEPAAGQAAPGNVAAESRP